LHLTHLGPAHLMAAACLALELAGCWSHTVICARLHGCLFVCLPECLGHLFAQAYEQELQKAMAVPLPDAGAQPSSFCPSVALCSVYVQAVLKLSCQRHAHHC
jgi:hypothetical protein